MFYSSELTLGAKDYQIFVMNIQTNNKLQLTQGNEFARHPAWTSLPKYKPKSAKPETRLDNQGRPSTKLIAAVCDS